MTPSPVLPEQVLYSVKEVATVLGFSTRAVWRMVSIGELPEPCRLNARCSRWLKEDVDDFIKKLKSNRKQGVSQAG